MLLHTFYTPGLSIYSYLVGDTATRRAVVIDPTREVTRYIEYAHQEGYIITDIVETHVHADFASGSKELKHQLQDKPIIHCSVMGGKEWLPQYADVEVKKGDILNLGSVKLQALHTPGHTPEHLTWLGYDESGKGEPALAFTGDFILVGSIGRPDLLGKEEIKRLGEQLYHSLFEVIAPLPDFLEIFPAHGAGSLCGKALSARPSTTLGYERLFNPFFQKKPLESWLEGLLLNIPAAPINFKRLKKLNVQGPPLINQEPVIEDEFITIDVRHPELFSKSHIKGSLNVPLAHSFCNWVGSVLEENLDIRLVASNWGQIDEAANDLQLIGFDKITKKIVWDENAVLDEYSLESLPLITVQMANDLLTNPQDNTYLVDVRTLSEWNAGHISEAHHLELAFMTEKLEKIPREASVLVICGSSNRSSIAASLFQRRGYPDVANIKGGMSAWTKAGLPIEKK